MVQDHLLAQARIALPVLVDRATQPAGIEGVREIVGLSFATYRQPKRQEGEWAAFWEPYTALCANLPLAALRNAMLVHMAGTKRDFLPRAGDLAELAKTQEYPEGKAVWIAQRAVAMADEAKQPVFSLRHPDMPKPKRMPPTPADIDAVHRMASDFGAHVEALHVREQDERPPGRPTHGQLVEGSALTAAMHDVLTRRKIEATPGDFDWRCEGD